MAARIGERFCIIEGRRTTSQPAGSDRSISLRYMRASGVAAGARRPKFRLNAARIANLMAEIQARLAGARMDIAGRARRNRRTATYVALPRRHGYYEQKALKMRPVRFPWLDSPDASAADQLRLDESLLLVGGGLLRVWETESECVVLGHSGLADRDVEVEACRSANVPILYRCSGGGAVLLGKGCLNYSMVLPFEWEPKWREVRYSLKWAMNRMCLALALPGLHCEGDCDLALQTRKVSGNAQRRTQRAILHHGTLLYDFDAARAERFLRPPGRQPCYRAGRTHTEFLGNLPLTPGEIRQRLREAWC